MNSRHDYEHEVARTEPLRRIHSLLFINTVFTVINLAFATVNWLMHTRLLP